jgi:predicted transposase YdaD
MTSHDNSYKLLFSHAEMVRDLLLGFVKEEWVRDLDFQTLEKVGSSYVSDDIRDRHDDIVWRVKWGKDWLYVYLLLEFQSTIDVYMPVRILTYVGLLYQDLIRTKQLPSSGKLPPVLPVVLYNGKRRWNASIEMSDLIQQVSGGLERIGPVSPSCCWTRAVTGMRIYGR